MIEAQDIPLENIEFDEVKIREAQVGTKEFDRLKYSIELEGVQLPILVRPKKDENGKIIPDFYLGIDGCQRWEISKLLDKKTIPARIMDHTEDDCRRLQMILNRNRVPQKKAQELEHVKTYMMHNPTMSQNDVAIAFNMHQAELSNLLGLERLTPEAMELLSTDKISPTNAIALSRLPSNYQNKYLNDAQDMKTNEFINHIKTESRKIKAELKGQPTDDIVPMVLRKKKWFEDELENLNHLVETTPEDNDKFIYYSGQLEFCKKSLQVDEESLAEKKAEKKAKEEEKKAKRKSVPMDEFQSAQDYIKELEERLAKA